MNLTPFSVPKNMKLVSTFVCNDLTCLLKESSTKDKISESPKNGFIFSSPEPKSQRFSVKETLEAADDEVNICFSKFRILT